MEEIKFEYIFETQRYGEPIKKVIYKIEELENMEMELYLLEQGYKIIARRQYTGLKDKNGKDIYNNDILQVDGKYNGIVEFQDGMFIIHRLDCSFCCPHTQELKNWASDGEIIGNVFENPELIELPKEFKPQTKYYNFNDKEHYSLKADGKIHNHYSL